MSLNVSVHDISLTTDNQQKTNFHFWKPGEILGIIGVE